jgi:16S rRNA (uracil1498-N3)-methyltransferase
MPRLHCPEPCWQGQRARPARRCRAPRAGAAAAARRRAHPVRRPRRRVRPPPSRRWAAADVRVQVGSHTRRSSASRRVRRAPGRRHARQRPHGLAGREGGRTRRGQPAAALQPSAACCACGRARAPKQAHWQAIAVAACEQCGRNRVPTVHRGAILAGWQPAMPPAGTVLSLAAGARPLADLLDTSHDPVLLLSAAPKAA